jgi:hypothetical protein
LGIIEHIEASKASGLDVDFMKSFVLTIGLKQKYIIFAVSGDYTRDNNIIFAHNMHEYMARCCKAFACD